MATPTLVLVIDDRPAEQVQLARLLADADCNVLFAADFSEATAVRLDVDIVVCRLRIGKTDGLEFMRRWHNQRRDTAFIVFISRDDATITGEAIKSGATGCLLEPIDKDEFRIWIHRCLAMKSRRQQIRNLQSRLDDRFEFERLIGQSAVMQRLIEQARAAGESTNDVVIMGEPGTGKALFAEIIHQNSARRGWPFITYQVAGLSVRQNEQDLFGTSRAAASDQMASDRGRWGAALGGTLFIDDISELAAVTQARLLRTLEGRGSDSPDPWKTVVDVRIIAATARKLDALSAEGRFSAVLFRRLSGYQLRLPPLRERRDDIPLLVDHFLQQAAQRHSRAVPACEPELLRFFERFDWPENVRQLRNCLESMIAISRRDVLSLDDLPANIDDPAAGPAGMYLPPGMTLAEIERTAIEQALLHCGGNRTRAAELLGISVRTLQRKLKCWSLEGLELDEVASLPARVKRSI